MSVWYVGSWEIVEVDFEIEGVFDTFSGDEFTGLLRCGKSCRLRWTNYLRPDIKRGRFSHEEDQMIVHLHAMLGNRY